MECGIHDDFHALCEQKDDVKLSQVLDDSRYSRVWPTILYTSTRTDEHSRYLLPVSYTHLDVYKRQVNTHSIKQIIVNG